MSQENVEIVRRATEEFSRGETGAVIDIFWVPEIIWDMTHTHIPGFGVYTGYYLDRPQALEATGLSE